LEQASAGHNPEGPASRRFGALGFGRDEARVFHAVIDDLDRKCSGLDESWLGRVAQAYKERQTMAVAKTKGYVFRGREVVQTAQGPKVQLRFAVR
jgi:hypothetical protein